MSVDHHDSPVGGHDHGAHGRTATITRPETTTTIAAA